MYFSNVANSKIVIALLKLYLSKPKSAKTNLRNITIAAQKVTNGHQTTISHDNRKVVLKFDSKSSH